MSVRRSTPPRSAASPLPGPARRREMIDRGGVPMTDVRVLIVDDQEPFRRAMAAVVDATDGFVVVGSATLGRGVVGRGRRAAPGPGADGRQPARASTGSRPPGASRPAPDGPGRGAAVDVRRGPVRPRRLRCGGVHRQGRRSGRTGSQRPGPRPAPDDAGARPARPGSSRVSGPASVASRPPTASTRSLIAWRSTPSPGTPSTRQHQVVARPAPARWSADRRPRATPRRSRSRRPPPPAAGTCARPRRRRRAR